MRTPDEARCHICHRIFCCGKCRQKHQIATHAIAVVREEPLSEGLDMDEPTTVYVFCPICEQKPLPLRQDMYPELLQHIEAAHLPLKCRKCQRLYAKIEDLREFTRCLNIAQDCQSGEEAKRAVFASTISTQTSPHKDMNETPQLTPISLINLRWKAKSKMAHEEFISDSVSSIRNLSSISNSSMQCKGKVIRSTSTPLQLDTVFAKPKEPLTFNASCGAHMSSIYHSEAEPSPALPLPPPVAPEAALQRARKVGGRPTALTPLRQVMSKSIQKAFVEHGGLPATHLMVQRRPRLDLSEQSCVGHDVSGCALDLRLSPVVRRTESQEEVSRKHNPSQMLVSAQKLTTESIIITRTKLQSSEHQEASQESGATVYNSCHSVEIITATSEVSSGVALAPITPITRIPGAALINKKLIKFETPQKREPSEEKDVFYTPNPLQTPDQSPGRRTAIMPRQLSDQFSPERRKSAVAGLPRPRPPLRVCQQSEAFSGVQDIHKKNSRDSETEDEVFAGQQEQKPAEVAQNQNQGSGRLWSLMASVMRLPASLKGEGSGATAPGSLLRRCASFAGSLVRPKPEQAEMQSLKRKRTHTLDNQHSAHSFHDPMSPASASKRLRIQPRKPMARMRLNT